MENAFLATKVTFVNQFFDIAVSLGVNFDELRQLWLLDGRVGGSHTTVTAERGFSGRCLPKDLLAMITAMRAGGGAPLLEAVFSYNELLNRNEHNL
jgi:UDP-glucose 6-dehydrogenase